LNNLVMQTLWRLPNKILRHIHKKRFSVFLSRFLRDCNQSLQKVLIRAKNVFINKFNKGINKRRISRWFQICWKGFEKMHQKKVINKNVTEICPFFTFTHARQTCFGAFFTTFSTDSKSAWNSAFLIPFCFFSKKIFWGSYLHFLKSLEPNAQKLLKKIKKCI